MHAHRFTSAFLLTLILPAMLLPAGERIVVKCFDGRVCPDVTLQTLTPAELKQCERVCELLTQCAEDAEECEQPCDPSPEHLGLDACLKRCLITTEPPRDATSDGVVRVYVLALAPLPIADQVLSSALAHDASEFIRAVEHVPIIVHRFELHPDEGPGARSPPHITVA
jgi:hypothetical protein